MHSMLNTLRRELWLTLMVFPLEPAHVEDERFDFQVLQHRLDAVQPELYLHLKKHYLCFADHLEKLKEAGKLEEEGPVWANRLLALRGHILHEQEAWTTHPSRGTLGAWPTVDAAHWLVSLPHFAAGTLPWH